MGRVWVPKSRDDAAGSAPHGPRPAATRSNRRPRSRDVDWAGWRRIWRPRRAVRAPKVAKIAFWGRISPRGPTPSAPTGLTAAARLPNLERTCGAGGYGGCRPVWGSPRPAAAAEGVNQRIIRFLWTSSWRGPRPLDRTATHVTSSAYFPLEVCAGGVRFSPRRKLRDHRIFTI